MQSRNFADRACVSCNSRKSLPDGLGINAAILAAPTSHAPIDNAGSPFMLLVREEIRAIPVLAREFDLEAAST